MLDNSTLRPTVLPGIAFALMLISLIICGPAAAQHDDALPPPFMGNALKTVSPEEEANLSQEDKARWKAVLLRQSVYPGIEDQVISYRTYEPNDGLTCPYTREEIEEFIENGQVKALPEACYRAYASYIHYPQGTGSAEVDRIIKREFGRGPMPDDYLAYSGYLLNYVIGRPSSRCISIAFCEQHFGTESRYYQIWSAYSYDLKTGHALTLEDVFPDMKYSEAPLEIYLYKRLWPNPRDIAVPEDYPGPKEFRPIDMNIKRLFLTEDGLHVIFNLYEQGSYGDGLKFVHIPLADLAGLGANTALWGK